MRKLEDWSAEISELEDFFTSTNLPTIPIKLDDATTILDCQRFVENHLGNVKANEGKIRFKVYLNRLKKLKNKL